MSWYSRQSQRMNHRLIYCTMSAGSGVVGLCSLVLAISAGFDRSWFVAVQAGLGAILLLSAALAALVSAIEDAVEGGIENTGWENLIDHSGDLSRLLSKASHIEELLRYGKQDD